MDQELEERVKQLEKQVEELKAALSIQLEYIWETRELLAKFENLLDRALAHKLSRSELESLIGFDIVKHAQAEAGRKSKVDAKLDKALKHIWEDYYSRFEG